MADIINKVKLPDNKTYNIEGSVHYVCGTQTAATGAWTGNLNLPALYDGLTIMYYLPWAGSGNATLNLTLSDGSTTGAKNCYYNTSRLTTHYGKGCNIIMTYHPAGSITVDGTATTDDRWIANANYADGNNTYYLSNYYNYFVAGPNKIFPYTIVMQNADGRWESIVTSSSTGTSKARNTHGFRLGQLAYLNANSTYAENAKVGDNQISYHKSDLIDHRYSFNTANNSTSGTTTKKPVYLVGAINASDGLFYLDATWWTQTLPTTADGKLYIYLGDAYDYYRMSFVMDHPVYWYRNGMIREFAQDAATVNGHTVEKDVPSNAVFTDNDTHRPIKVNGTQLLGNNSTAVNFKNGTNVTVSGSGSDISFASETAYLKTEGDNRNVATTPNDYTDKLIFKGLKTNSKIGSPSSDTYSYLVGLRGWSDSSGGNAHELAFNNSGIYMRQGATTSFGDWQKIAKTGDIPTKTSQLTNDSGFVTGDTKVTQTADDSTNSNFECLFSATADNTTRTETSKKSSKLKFNPSTGNLQATQLNGVTIGSSPKFTDTTYTFANGTNGFTVTPSGGTAQTVTVTPNDTTKLPLSGGTLTGRTIFKNVSMPISAGKVTSLAAGTTEIFKDGIAISNPTTANDVGWIRVLGTGETDTVLEIATGDDAGSTNPEEIVARQYNTSNKVVHEAKLLDKTGNAIFPKDLSVGGASGATLQYNITTQSLDFVFA